MSEPARATPPARPPKWDLADRMRKSLREAGLGVSDMADYLDVSRTTVSNWINGRIYPSMATQRLWALRTGMPFTWLHHGDMQPCDLRQVPAPAGSGGSLRSPPDTMQCSQTKLGVA